MSADAIGQEGELIRLYDYLPSGNGYKVRLLLTQLEIPYQVEELDITTGVTREPAFLAKNPNGKIPTVELEDGRFLCESHAILIYFAEETRFVPVDRYERARMWQWMCFEQYSLEPLIGTARFWLHSLHQTPEELGERLLEKQAAGRRALTILDAHLGDEDWMAAGRYTLADIALYAYTHVADEAGLELDEFPAVRAWHERVRTQPHHVPITQA